MVLWLKHCQGGMSSGEICQWYIRMDKSWYWALIVTIVGEGWMDIGCCVRLRRKKMNSEGWVNVDGSKIQREYRKGVNVIGLDECVECGVWNVRRVGGCGRRRG